MENNKNENSKISKSERGKDILKNINPIIVTLIAGICIIMSINTGIKGLLLYKKSGSGGITVTGSASRDFTSDLIVWRGTFSAFGSTTKEAYEIIKEDAEIIKNYLIENGVSEEELVFYSVNTSKDIKYVYNDNGTVVSEYLNGYNLYQELSIQSNDVKKIENISRDISKLIDLGVEFSSFSPEYYYTKLDELKLEMIELATQNAKERIDKIAQNSNSVITKLINANLGVFQITARNSNLEDYSYGGTFNTSSKEKTASITVKLNYGVE